jgi:hypothetical protein
MDVDPALFRDPQPPRLASAGEHDRRSLVDLIARHHQPPVGLGNQAVALG